MQSTEEITAEVVNGISVLIMRTARNFESERRNPSPDSDGSDAIIETLRKRLIELRSLRDRIENTMTE